MTRTRVADTQFTCEHCGAAVPWAEFENEPKPRNHCPFCLWSRHVSLGAEQGYPPCGAMMKGTDVGGSEYVSRCLGCGFMMRVFTDDYLLRVLASPALVRSVPGTIYSDPGVTA